MNSLLIKSTSSSNTKTDFSPSDFAFFIIFKCDNIHPYTGILIFSVLTEIIYGIQDEPNKMSKHQIEAVDFWLEVRTAYMKIRDNLINLMPDEERLTWETFMEFYEKVN